MALVPNLYRPVDDRMLAGVCSGIARYLGVEVKLVRVLTVLAVVAGGMSLWVYPLLWLLMPEQGSETAGVDTLIRQAKQWKTGQDASTSTGSPAEVFNPYDEQEPRR